MWIAIGDITRRFWPQIDPLDAVIVGPSQEFVILRVYLQIRLVALQQELQNLTTMSHNFGAFRLDYHAWLNGQTTGSAFGVGPFARKVVFDFDQTQSARTYRRERGVKAKRRNLNACLTRGGQDADVIASDDLASIHEKL